MTTLSLQSFTVVETSHHPQHWETAPSVDAGQIVRSNILLRAWPAYQQCLFSHLMMWIWHPLSQKSSKGKHTAAIWKFKGIIIGVCLWDRPWEFLNNHWGLFCLLVSSTANPPSMVTIRLRLFCCAQRVGVPEAWHNCGLNLCLSLFAFRYALGSYHGCPWSDSYCYSSVGFRTISHLCRTCQ